MAMPPARSALRGFLALGAAVLLAIAVAASVDAWRKRSARQAKHALGERLFDGRASMPATLAGHGKPLPPGTLRCSQCHAGPAANAPAIADARALAPTLDRDHLRRAMARRNGPPTAYDVADFCRALRTGIDPAHVTLPRTMPRFEIDDARCDALWTYLTEAPE